MTFANIALMLASVAIMPFLIRLIPDQPLAIDPVTIPPEEIADAARTQARRDDEKAGAAGA
jgi:hypothetical protein